MEDLKDASYRTLLLDSEVIPILTDFLLTCDENKQVAILCSLDWLNHFIDFFREDFLSVVDRARAIHLNNASNNGLNAQHPNGNIVSQSANNPLGIEEESKDPASGQFIEEEKQNVSKSQNTGNFLTIDTSGG